MQVNKFNEDRKCSGSARLCGVRRANVRIAAPSPLPPMIRVATTLIIHHTYD